MSRYDHKIETSLEGIEHLSTTSLPQERDNRLEKERIIKFISFGNPF